jgi:hypothetical protein
MEKPCFYICSHVSASKLHKVFKKLCVLSDTEICLVNLYG